MFSRTQFSQKHGMVARYLRIAPTVCARLFHPHCREQQRQATWWSQHLRWEWWECPAETCRFGPLKVFLAKRVVHAFLLDYDSKYQSCRKKNSSSLIDCREYSRSSNEDLPRTHFSAAWDRMHLIALLKDTPLNRLTGRPSMLSFWKDRAQPKRLRLVTSLNLIPRGSTVTSCKTEHFHHAWQCLTQVVQSYRIPPSKICINLLLPTLLQKSCWMITRTWVSDMSILQAMLDLKEQWMSKKLNPGWFLSTPYMKWIVYKLPHMQCIYIYVYVYNYHIYIYYYI